MEDRLWRLMETGTRPTFRRTEKTLKNEMRRSPEKYKDQHVTLITFHVSAWTKLLNWIIIFSVCGEEVSEAQKIRCFVWSLPPGKWPSLHPLYKVQPLYHIPPYKCLPQSCTASGNQATFHVRTEAWEGETTCQRAPGFLWQKWDESQGFWLPASCYSGSNRLLDYIFTCELSLGNEVSLVYVS